MYPKKFNDLIQAFRKLPGVGQKTAERYAYTVLGWNEEEFTEFQNAPLNLFRNTMAYIMSYMV